MGDELCDCCTTCAYTCCTGCCTNACSPGGFCWYLGCNGWDTPPTYHKSERQQPNQSIVKPEAVPPLQDLSVSMQRV